MRTDVDHPVELAAAIHSTGTIEGVVEIYERAALLAAESRDDFVHALAWLNIVGVVAVRNAKTEETDRIVHAAEAAILRAGRPPYLVSMLAGRRADIAFERQQYAAAVPLFEAAIEGWAKRFGANEPDLARWHDRLGSTLARRRRFEQTRGHLQRARAILEGHYGSIHTIVGVVITTLSQLEYRIGDYVAAETLAKQALDIEIATRATDTPRSHRRCTTSRSRRNAREGTRRRSPTRSAPPRSTSARYRRATRTSASRCRVSAGSPASRATGPRRKRRWRARSRS